MTRKYFPSILLLLSAVVFVFLQSCNPARKYEKDEKNAINNYLSSNNTLNFEKKESGLYYLQVTEGTGVTPIAHDTAFIQYTVKFLDGTVYDSNVGKADWEFPVGEGYAISGIDEGVTYMKVGGKSTLLIPSSLGYGTTGYYTIPGYTPLLFEVTLTKVKPGSSR